LLLSESRAPRLLALVNGAVLTSVTDAEVIANNHYAADRFRATAALAGDPVLGSAFWSSTDTIAVDIRFSLDGGASFTSLIRGNVDKVSLDPATGLVHLEGRDLSAAMIEARTQEAFANRTASEIATILAQRHGLTPNVRATPTPVGRYYQNEHDQITLDQFSFMTTEWDLLCNLARLEGFDVFVSGGTLNFQPAFVTPDVVLSVTPTDLVDLRMERCLTLARGIQVTVKSWNARQQTMFAETATLAGGGSPQTYVFVQPNLTPDQALNLAQRKLAELAQHERVIELTMPGELTLTPRSLITLTETGTAFDQSYFVDTIERRIGVGCGFVQRVRAKNMSSGGGAVGLSSLSNGSGA
jgi:hypothetical protein